MVTVTIIAIGNEILCGDVLDTNTHWLCNKITGIGGQIKRAAIVRDELEAIGSEISSALNGQIKVIMTTGGLGPTADDKTLEAIAKSVNRPLELNEQAFNFVKEKYSELQQKGYVADATMTASRQKMAMLPRGAQALENQVGGAPGVLLYHQETAIISLPGVPAELKDIFENALQPFLRKIFGNSVYIEKTTVVNCNDESVLAPLLKKVSDTNPHIYVKSRAKRFGPDVKFKVTLSATGRSKAKIKQQIDRTIRNLKQVLEKSGITIELSED